jgi:transcriptional regulator with XRE-family HTH domain
MAGEWQQLADHIRAEMSRRGWTQHDLAEAAGIGEKTVNTLLSGRERPRLPRTMPAVEVALGWRPGTARRIVDGEDPLGAEGDGRITHNDLVDMAIQQLRKVPARDRLRLLSRLISEVDDELDDEASR